MKLKSTTHCALSSKGNADTNNIIFTIRDRKLYVSVVTLSAEDSQKLSNFFSKRFARSLYSNKQKTKSENKNTTNKCRDFVKSNFLEVSKLFASIM